MTTNFKRSFVLPKNRFASNSPWNTYVGVGNNDQKVVPAVPDSELQCLATFELFRQGSFLAIAEQALGDKVSDQRRNELKKLLTNAEHLGGYLKIPEILSEQFTFPIFEADMENLGDIPLIDYAGESINKSNPTVESDCDSGQCLIKEIPQSKNRIRSSSPENPGADGCVILIDTVNCIAFDFYQPTIKDEQGQTESRGGFEGDTIVSAGGVARFDFSQTGAGHQSARCEPLGSSRASGLPYLGGLIVAEDFLDLDTNDPGNNSFSHALAFVTPGMRYLATRYLGSMGFRSDYVFPASSSEKSLGTVNPFALAAGQQIRLKDTIVDEFGYVIDQSSLRPITQMFFNTLKDYGAFLVDGGLGFGFAAEDHRTSNLDLELQTLNWLVTSGGETPDRNGRGQWEFLMDELTNELGAVQFVFASNQVAGDKRSDGLVTSNFEVIG